VKATTSGEFFFLLVFFWVCFAPLVWFFYGLQGFVYTFNLGFGFWVNWGCQIFVVICLCRTIYYK